MRAYTFWCLRDWLDPQFNPESCLPPDDELKAQVTEIKFKIRPDGSIQIENKDDIKKRIGVSPDKADGLAMTFAPEDRLYKAQRKRHKSPKGREFNI